MELLLRKGAMPHHFVYEIQSVETFDISTLTVLIGHGLVPWAGTLHEQFVRTNGWSPECGKPFNAKDIGNKPRAEVLYRQVFLARVVGYLKAQVEKTAADICTCINLLLTNGVLRVRYILL